MGTLLIGDVGSTKGNWYFLRAGDVLSFTTPGYNPVQHAERVLDTLMESVRSSCPGIPDTIFYYGAGVISSEIVMTLTSEIHKIFPHAVIRCDTDLAGAALSVSAGSKGIVTILGTGSNSCLFSGTEVIRQIPGLGFPLGDEGSGADIGKAIVRAFYYGQFNEQVRQAVAQKLPAERPEFLARFRESEAPNRYLASLVPLVVPFIEDPVVQNLIRDRLKEFVQLRVLPYGTEAPVHSVGGIAFVFRDILRAVLAEVGLRAGNIVDDPLPGLVHYHQKKDL